MIRTLLFLLVVCCLVGCAFKVAPTGGPADKTPALVTTITPPSGTRNLRAPYFTVEFNDYVDRGIRNTISVIPKARINSSYNGDAIDIWFEEDPLPNTTYAITIGTNWKDLKGNAAPEATSIIFSSGADLDSGTIKGTVQATNFQNVVVFAYPQANTLTSTFNPRETFAPYQVPVGSQGVFSINALKDGQYRILSVRDANNNQLADHDEEFGVASLDIVVEKGASADVHLLLLPRADTNKPDSNDHAVHQTAQDSTKADSANKTTERKMYPGSVNGIFIGPAENRGTYVARFHGQSGTIEAQIPVQPDTRWSIDSIPAGTYSVDVFVDVDGNGVYSNGSVYPFKFSEPRYVLTTSVVVRERWTTDDVKLEVIP